MKTIENQRNLSEPSKGQNATPECGTLLMQARCPFCNQRLFDVTSNSCAEIQIKCPKCSRTVSLVIDKLKNGVA